MRILLTGATGFLGNNLLHQLLAAGHQVTVTVRPSSDPRPLDGCDVEKCFADLTETSEISPFVSQQDAVIHSAALIQIGWTNLAESRRVNVLATKNLATAARRSGIRMVHVSTVDTLPLPPIGEASSEDSSGTAKPACSYVVSKQEAEAAFLEEVKHGLDGVIVHPGFMIGPLDWKPSSGQMMLALARQYVPLAPAGGCSVADVRDVARGVRLALDKGVSGRRYILGGHNLSYLQLWTEMANVLDRRPPFGKLPDWLARTAGIVGDSIGKISSKEPPVNTAATAMGQLQHWYCSDRAEKELGYQIGPLKPALLDAWDWFKCNGYV